MESLPSTVDAAIEPAVGRVQAGGRLRIAAARRELIANALLGGMLVCGFLMAAGAAAKRYGPTLHIHHHLRTEVRGPLHLVALSLSGTGCGAIFLLRGGCALGGLALADSVRLRVGIGAIGAM